MNHTKQNIPKHVGLIPDGTRRWAQANGFQFSEAYMCTMKAIIDFMRIMYSEGVQSISIYLLSKENLKRKSCDLVPVIDAEVLFLQNYLPQIVEDFNVKIVHAGLKRLLPHRFAQLIQTRIENTQNHCDKKLYILAGYSPLDELETASTASGSSGICLSHLWVPEPLDLVIRTSGELRLSNFLPVQSGYAELIFSQKHFNDLAEDDVKRFIQTYAERKRRFGQ